jgi:hypothetical protein
MAMVSTLQEPIGTMRSVQPDGHQLSGNGVEIIVHFKKFFAQ